MKAKKPMLTGIGYREQDGCHNCRHVFVLREHDDPDTLYCTEDGTTRPPTPWVAMDEIADVLDGEDWHKRMRVINKAWDAWAEGREVHPAGICDQYETKRKEARHEG